MSCCKTGNMTRSRLVVLGFFVMMRKSKSHPSIHPSITGPFLSFLLRGLRTSGPCAVPDAVLNSINTISPEQARTSAGIRYCVSVCAPIILFLFHFFLFFFPNHFSICNLSVISLSVLSVGMRIWTVSGRRLRSLTPPASPPQVVENGRGL